MAESKHSKSARGAVTAPALPNLTAEERLRLTWFAAEELDDLMWHAIDIMKGAAVSKVRLAACDALARRANSVAMTLQTIANQENDEDQDGLALGRSLYYARESRFEEAYREARGMAAAEDLP